MSRLPDFIEPITDAYLFDIPIKDMDRTDLLKTIKWLSDEVKRYQELYEKEQDKIVEEFKLRQIHDT